MKDTNIVTKLSKLDISRIALCKSPADQDGNFVIVKSEDVNGGDVEAPAAEPVVDEVEKTEEDAESLVVKVELSEDMKVAIEKAVQDCIVSIEKSPVIANSNSDIGSVSNTEIAADDDGGKEAIQACIKELVESCNATKIVPKKMKKQVANIAKYHGVEGPADDDGMEAGAFAEVTAELKTVVDILKGFAVSMAKFTAPASQPPAPAAAPAKPSPAKKSTDEDDERIARLEKGFERARFALLQAMGKDPTPPTE